MATTEDNAAGARFVEFDPIQSNRHIRILLLLFTKIYSKTSALLVVFFFLYIPKIQLLHAAGTTFDRDIYVISEWHWWSPWQILNVHLFLRRRGVTFNYGFCAVLSIFLCVNPIISFHHVLQTKVLFGWRRKRFDSWWDRKKQRQMPKPRNDSP